MKLQGSLWKAIQGHWVTISKFTNDAKCKILHYIKCNLLSSEIFTCLTNTFNLNANYAHLSFRVWNCFSNSASIIFNKHNQEVTYVCWANRGAQPVTHKPTLLLQTEHLMMYLLLCVKTVLQSPPWQKRRLHKHFPQPGCAAHLAVINWLCVMSLRTRWCAPAPLERCPRLPAHYCRRHSPMVFLRGGRLL